MPLTSVKYKYPLYALFSLFLLLGISSNLFAQARENDFLGTPSKKERRNNIGLSLGSATPLGQFAATKASSTESGYASNGAGIEIQYSYELQESIAISILLGSHSFSVNEEAYLNAVRSFNPPGTYELEVESYVEDHLLIGVKFMIDDNPRWYINPFFGSISLSIPRLSLNQKIDGRPDLSGSISTNEANSRAFAYGISIGGEYFFTERFGVNLNGQYIRSGFDVESLGFANFDNGTSIVFLNNYQQPYEVLSIKLGAIFRF